MDLKLSQLGRTLNVDITVLSNFYTKVKHRFSVDGFSQLMRDKGLRCNFSSSGFDLYAELDKKFNTALLYLGTPSTGYTYSRNYDTEEKATEALKELGEWMHKYIEPIYNKLETEEELTNSIIFKDRVMTHSEKLNLPKVDDIKVTNPSLISINGVIYEATRIKEGNNEEILEELKNSLKKEYKEKEKILVNNIKEYKYSLERNYQKELDALKNRVLFPEYLNVSTLIRYDYKIALSDSGNITFFLPITYQPTKMIKNNTLYTINFPISPKQVWLVFTISRETKVPYAKTIHLRYKHSLNQFKHYHTIDRYEDCIGDIKLFSIKSLEDLIKFRDYMEESLKIINADSIAMSNPPKLDDIDDIEITEEESGWTAV